MKLLKKISASDILGNVVAIVKDMEVGQRIEAFAVAGICDAYETGISQYGEWVRFVGSFEAVNYTDGEVIRAPAAHVPDVLQAVMLDGVKEHAEVVKSKCKEHSTYFQMDRSIEFAYKVEIERLPDTDKEINNYKYITSPMVDIAANDSIGHLTKLIQPALGAPEAQVDIEEVTGAKLKKAPAKKAAAK